MSPDTPEPEAQEPLPESVTHQRLTEVFRREYRKLVDRVYRGLSGDKKNRRDAAEEIVARAVLKVLEKDRESDAIGNVVAYLRKAVQNELHNEHREDGKLHQTRLALEYELGGTAPSAEWICLSDEQRRLLQDAVEDLPPKCRAAFRWMMWEHLTPKEVVARFATKGIKITDRQVLRYRDAGCKACRRAFEAYEERRIVEDPRKEGVG